MDKNTAIKNRNLTFERANKKLVPQVVRNLEKDLTEEFEQQSLAKRYNDDILRSLEESSR